MNLIKKCLTNFKKITVMDMACVKISTAAATLALVKFVPNLLMLQWHWYVLIAIVAAAKPVSKVCK
jgi:hypothetical protein